MKPFQTVILAALLALTTLFALPALAQDKKCDGPAELCAQVLELKKDLAAQKAATVQTAAADDAASQAKAAAEQAKMAKLVALAATAAVVLKLLVSMLKTWTTWLKTDKQKAVMKAVLLLLGFASFIAGNMGLGLPWWQAIIVAGGPPGAILVHELMDLWAAFTGRKPLPPDPVDPSDPPAPAAA